jgi:hypothetical protein
LNVLQSAPTTSVATQSSTTGISTSLPGLRGRISLRIASREVDANRGAAQQITSQRTKHKIEQAFERVARERTAQFTQKLREQYAKLPLDGRFALSDIQCSTTADALQIEVIARGDKEQTLAEAPPPAKDHPDIEVYIHSALLQKLMVSAELRKTLQAAVLGMVEEPLVKMVKATATAPAKGALPPPPPQPDREMEFHWTEGGDLPWLSLCWHEKTPANGNGSTKNSDQRVITPGRSEN